MVFCTCPDQATALDLAETLVRDGLAACVTLSGPVTSVYTWQGRVQREAEVLLLLKTPVARYPALEAALLERHPYELPEILAVPIEQGLPGYLQWVETCTTTAS
jgi:periplasmic divalent cation tolerance protein